MAIGAEPILQFLDHLHLELSNLSSEVGKMKMFLIKALNEEQAQKFAQQKPVEEVKKQEEKTVEQKQ